MQSSAVYVGMKTTESLFALNAAALTTGSYQRRANMNAVAVESSSR